MKAKGIKAMMSALEKAGVHVCGTTDEFYGSKNDNNGIWVAAESHSRIVRLL
jgi:lipoate-protein ligase B